MVSNSLYIRLIGHSRWPTGQIALKIGLAGGIISLALAIGFSQTDWKAAPLEVLVRNGPLIILAQGIVAIASTHFAARLVRHDLTAGSQTALVLAALSSARIVKDYFLAVLFRLRLVLILLVILTPIMVMSLIYIDYGGNDYISKYQNYCTYGAEYDYCSKYLDHFRLPDVPLSKVLEFSAYALQLWGIELLSIAIGIFFGLNVKSSASLILLSFTATTFLLFLYLVQVGPTMVAFDQSPAPMPTILVFTILPYVLSLGIYFLARRSVPIAALLTDPGSPNRRNSV